MTKLLYRIPFESKYAHFRKQQLTPCKPVRVPKTRSTEYAALELSNDTGRTLYEFSLILTNAFDRLDHTILIQKLNHCGTIGSSLTSLQSY